MTDYRIVIVVKAATPPVAETRALLEALRGQGAEVDTADVQARDPEVWSLFHTVEGLA